MTEYNCSCHVDGKSYDFQTLGAVTIWQALEQFSDLLISEGASLARVDGLTLDLIEIEYS